jgi:asparagine synthase (glutamine-hydrolysing)
LAPYFRANAGRLRDRLLGAPMLSHDLFDGAAIAKLLDEHEAGAFDHAQAIWLLLAFEGFLFSLSPAAETIA